MARVIGEVRPRFALVENSPMLLSRGLGTVLGDLSEMGYDAEWGVIGAHHVGAPHKRDRIWILAYTGMCKGRNGIGRSAGRNGERKLDTGERSTATVEIAGSSQASRTMADSEHSGLQGQSERCMGWTSKFTTGSKKLADSSGQGLQRPDVREAEHGTSDRLLAERCTWWDKDPGDEPESGVGRVAHGVANRVDRLKAIGNGQVPAVVRLAWEILSERLT